MGRPSSRNLPPLWAAIFGIGLIVPVTLCLLDNKKRKEDRCTLAAESISVKPSFVIFVSLALLVLLVLSGIGEFVFTSEDHRVRYAILNDLVHYKWPVVYDYSTQTNPAVIAQLGNGHGALTYYLVFWMFPALVGKMFGLLAARIALVIWSAIGMFLVTIGVSLMYRTGSRTHWLCTTCTIKRHWNITKRIILDEKEERRNAGV